MLKRPGSRDRYHARSKLAMMPLMRIQLTTIDTDTDVNWRLFRTGCMRYESGNRIRPLSHSWSFLYNTSLQYQDGKSDAFFSFLFSISRSYKPMYHRLSHDSETFPSYLPHVLWLIGLQVYNIKIEKQTRVGGWKYFSFNCRIEWTFLMILRHFKVICLNM